VENRPLREPTRVLLHVPTFVLLQLLQRGVQRGGLVVRLLLETSVLDGGVLGECEQGVI